MRIEWISDSTLTELVLLTLAFVLSAVIGAERHRQLKSAGLRTHTLVGLGSAVFTLVSAYGFAQVTDPSVIVDPSRIAAQIVSGVGFLGAGVIFVRQNVVNGLTTAASIWVTAAIGMACGAGMPVLAVVTTLLHLAAVGLLSMLGRRIPVARGETSVIVVYADRRGVLRTILEAAAERGFEAMLKHTKQLEPIAGKPQVQATMTFHRGRGPLSDLIEAISHLRGVSEVSVSRVSEDEDDEDD